MTQRAELLDLERRKLMWLRNKLIDLELRIKTLEAMEDDPFDALLEREFAASVQASAPMQAGLTNGVQTPASPVFEPPAGQVVATGLTPSAVESASMPYAWQQRPRRVPETWVKLLLFIGLEGKTYDQVVDYITQNNLSVTPGAARTQLMNYRKDYGFVENPKKGVYLATQKALDFIFAQEQASGRKAESALRLRAAA